MLGLSISTIEPPYHNKITAIETPIKSLIGVVKFFNFSCLNIKLLNFRFSEINLFISFAFILNALIILMPYIDS